MIKLRKAADRGASRTSWLESRHSFSFADYYAPAHMGFGKLRVINDDVVAPGNGFGRHPHRDMEIVSYVLQGALQHGDSMGNEGIIAAGDVQRMTAGTGVVHSEQNASKSEPVHFLQIWIEPDTRGLPPGYEQKRFDTEAKHNVLRLAASPDGRDGSVRIRQDVAMYASVLDVGKRVQHPIEPGRRAWVQVATGAVRVNGQDLSAGDGAAIEGETAVEIEGREPSELLLFDLV
jgi:redox-sensitive bicupin YhaK (pirin superfamily)